MFVPRPTSPVSFEPLSPGPSDDVFGFSDSDEDLDEASRAAKRRRIEALARDYLGGQQLFISTASLKGPLENGWKNPWKRDKSKKKRVVQTYEESTVSASTSTITDRFRGRPPPKHPPSLSRRDSRLSDYTHVSESDAGWKQCPSDHRPNFSNQGPPLPPTRSRSRSIQSKSSNSKRRRTDLVPEQSDKPKRSRHSDNSWLKKDELALQIRGVQPPEPPSPTPCRPPSRARPDTDVTNISVAAHRTIGFTAVNAPRRNPTPPRPPIPPSASTDKTSMMPPQKVTSRKATARKSDSSFSKPIAPASSTRQSNRKDTRSFSASVVAGTSSRKPDRMATSTEQAISFEHPRGTDKQPHTRDITARHDLQEASSQTSDIQIRLKKQAVSFVSSKESAHGLKIGTTATTQSDYVPSAQVLPEYVRFPDVLLSLHSTEFSEPAANPHEAQGDGSQHDEDLSTQTPVIVAQALQDHAAQPRGTASEVDQISGEIRPFHSFHSATSIEERPSGATSKKVRAAANGTKSGDLCTSKKVQFGTEAGKGADEVNVDATRSKDGVVLQTNGVLRHDLPSPILLKENSSMVSSGTLLPFTLTASSNGTKPQDGQGMAPDLDDFDLSQAIADAGSFLQSWDVERDLSFQARKGAAMASGRALQQQQQPPVSVSEGK